ncbi:hypothetical protein J4U00_gp068 [Mycobacterium phage DyoEdafos]|uniref:Uncharacterized protein n=1 Tax=Mycobacterium phage DyoEdafos TaxID=2599860 RepID=A0A5J6THH1_9CAUD|nr:hypothetical protein J4U00_gp068 [Mycobacterium phage DyoEdafos]QFG10371.1 hypothetical protein SEA_DYOEDAFOS_68 [Mycobacterium phage DyoEdafos]
MSGDGRRSSVGRGVGRRVHPVRPGPCLRRNAAV